MFCIKTVLVGIILVLAGCASTEPAKFYTLRSIPGSDMGGLPETALQGISIGVGPISIPDYLDRQQIVTTSKQNNVELSEFNRWAGSLKDSIVRVLSENLSILLSSDRVFLFPWRGAIIVDYHIGVDVIQFDGELGGNATLTARWGIFSGKGKKELLVKKSNFTEPVGEKGYDALVAAQSRALMHLSRDMAAAIKTLSKGMPDQ